jgi:hypothetical protein
MYYMAEFNFLTINYDNVNKQNQTHSCKHAVP